MLSSTIAFGFFRVGNIKEVSETDDLNNFSLLCGTDHMQDFEVNVFISGILVSLSIAHFANSFIKADLYSANFSRANDTFR